MCVRRLIVSTMSSMKTGLYYQVGLHLVLFYLFKGWSFIFWAELGYLAYLTYQILKSERVKGKIDNFSIYYHCTVYNLGVSPTLVLRWREGYSFRSSFKFKISEGSDQNWCFPDSESGKHQFCL